MYVTPLLKTTTLIAAHTFQLQANSKPIFHFHKSYNV